MKPTTPHRPLLSMLLSVLSVHSLVLCAISETHARDWPMWRGDASRSATTPEAIPDGLRVAWTRQLPPLDPAYHNSRLAFDVGYEPVVAGNRLFYASSDDDSVTCLDVRSGEQRWVFHAGGPVRLAPCVVGSRVWFGSDDGHVRALDAESGELIVRVSIVPSRRQVLGNRRMISVWPVRGGLVAHEGVVYAAAGVLPFEGIFITAIDAESGRTLWVNDRCGSIWGMHPHDARAMGGITPQGYLVVNGEELIVPCGTAYPARLRRSDGELIEFSLPKPGRRPGGWFTYATPAESKAARRGEIQFDKEVNAETHEDKPMTGGGVPGALRRIVAAGKTLNFDDPIAGISGEVHSAVLAGGRLFVTTREPKLWVLDTETSTPRHHSLPAPTEPQVPETLAKKAAELLAATSAQDGWALFDETTDPRLVEAVVRSSRLHAVLLERHGPRSQELRAQFARAGLLGRRITIVRTRSLEFPLPPWFAALVVQRPSSEAYLYRFVRPYGGVLAIDTPSSAAGETRSSGTLKLPISERGGEPETQANVAPSSRTDHWTFYRRNGALPGSSDYTGGWKSDDSLARAPFGISWFDDSLGHFKRSPQPLILRGVQVSHPKRWRHAERKKTQKGGYELGEAVLSDIYTGRVLRAEEHAAHTEQLALRNREDAQPNQYRPPYQKDAWKPDPPATGKRRNLLTGVLEERPLPKSYGCDGGVLYGALYTMRSGTPAVFDLGLESGTIHLSGPRSGCTNSLIPAGGLLNVPFFYEGCTCSYPLPVGMALHTVPERREQWAAWGEMQVDAIRRVGLNFGAPGDRATESGTLWLDVPSVGGPSPAVDLSIEGDAVRYRYRHSVWMERRRGKNSENAAPDWPWIGSSWVEGLRKLTVRGLARGHFDAYLWFSENRAPWEPGNSGERIFSVRSGEDTWVEDLSVEERAGGTFRSLRVHHEVRIEDGTLTLEFLPTRGEAMLSGLELVLREAD